MARILQSFFCACLILLSAGHTSNAASQPMSPTVTRTSATFPQPYPPGVDRLPNGYRGLDSNRFFSLFEARSAQLKRREYEKTEDYSARVSDIKKLLSPISTEVLYAFRSENFEFSYDADAEEFTAKNSAACQERSRDEGPLDQLTCRLSILTSKDRTYIAANAYGAQTEVESFEGTYFGVTMKLGSAIVDGYVSKRAVPNGSWVEISDRFKVSISKARKLGNEGINVLYVGRIIGIQIVEGPKHHSLPTREFPFENKRQTLALPFDVVEIVFYVPSTGEVLHRKSASNQ